MSNEQDRDLRRVLRERQRARNRISCLPCRERKVKCSREHPCATCVKRDHPDLCIYAARPHVPSAAAPSPGGTATARGSASPSGIPLPLMGGNSLLAIAREHSSHTHDAADGGGGAADDDDGDGGDGGDGGRGDALEDGVIPLLGLGIAHAEHSGRASSAGDDDDLYADLPSDQELLNLFFIYRTRVHPFQLILGDLDGVESELCDIVNQRSGRGQSGTGGSEHRVRFLCVLHAILAAGAQFSDLSPSDRTTISRRHIKISLNLLSMSECILQPFQEGVCARLILAHVLQNDGNPQAAWILSGSTIRMAVALGIPATSYPPRFGPPPVSPATARQLRLSIIWQDVLLSLAFNRPPGSQDMSAEEDLPRLVPASLNYGQAMNWLCHFTLRHWPYAAVWNQSPEAAVASCTAFFADMDRLEAALQDHLRARAACRSIQAVEEFYRIELHINSTVSTFCRPILSKTATAQHRLGGPQAELVLQRLQQSLKRGVTAFIRLRSVTDRASRSWAFVHNGLTSALLLSFMKETRHEAESRQIQDELIKSLTEGDDGPLAPDAATQMTTAHRKSLKALRSLRRISEEEERHRRTDEAGRPPTAASDGASGTAMAFPPMVQAMGGGSDSTVPYQDPGSADFDELLRSLDFNSALPLPMEAFDYINFDPMAPSASFGGNFGGF